MELFLQWKYQKWNTGVCHAMCWFFLVPIFTHYYALCVLSMYVLFCWLSFSLHCVFYFLFPLICHPILSASSSYYRSQQWLWNFDTKTRLGGGLPPALSPCVYFTASPPRSLSMTPGDDWVRCSHPWCLSVMSLAPPPLFSLSSPPFCLSFFP